jgi:8-oxo-dGTP pyrophosphatase MutT (NUDIX family)
VTRPSPASGDGDVVLIRIPGAAACSLRILIDDAPPPADPALDRAVERRWQAMKRQNPRLFGGGVLSVSSLDAAAGLIRCRRDDYRRLVVQPDVPTGVLQLAISGLVLAPDARGRPHVLLGRRGHRTRMYGGMWELTPAGGVEPPVPPARELAHGDLAAELVRELREETGLEPPPTRALPPALCIVLDRLASSYDIILRLDLPEPSTPRPSPGSQWESLEFRWLSLDDVSRFLAHEPVIEPTRAVLTDFHP